MGRLLTKGVGEQYKLPKRFRDEEEVVDNNDDGTKMVMAMAMVIPQYCP
jgi:hypothetical protein